jgi:hypothetical protein
VRLSLGRYRSGAARVLVCGLAGGLGAFLSVWSIDRIGQGQSSRMLGPPSWLWTRVWEGRGWKDCKVGYGEPG